MWKGAKTGLEQGAKTGFKWHKKRNLARFDNLEWRGTAVLRRSTSFQPFFCRSTPFFTRFWGFASKAGKKDVRKWRNGKGKKSVHSSFFPVPVFSLSFLGTSLVVTCPILSTISSWSMITTFYFCAYSLFIVQGFYEHSINEPYWRGYFLCTL